MCMLLIILYNKQLFVGYLRKVVGYRNVYRYIIFLKSIIIFLLTRGGGRGGDMMLLSSSSALTNIWYLVLYIWLNFYK